MTVIVCELQKIIDACKAINPLTGETVEHVYLTLTREHLPSGENVRLFRTNGPTGRLCCVKDREDYWFDIVAVFPAARVLKALEKRKAEP